MDGNNLGMMAEMLERCAVMNRVGDEGSLTGGDARYEEGERFWALLIPKGGAEGQAAERQRLQETFEVVVEADCGLLGYWTVFRRLRDGAAFRVTTRPTDAPERSTVKIRKLTAERWEIPRDMGA